jgi:hypothetical protein
MGKQVASEVVITGAEVRTGDGRLAASIDAVHLGGGTQTVTVDGVPEERVHPVSRAFHVRLLAPDRMIPDELRQAATYEEAVEVGLKYAAKLAEHADRLAELAQDLKVE